ncbi:MAG: AMP-binding protein [Gammaproteobacteria bacterium]|nr:AMP-binding protein [Gammaproteobacteria bacterium]
MRQYRSPGEVKIAPTDNALSALLVRADTRPDAPTLAYRDGDRFVDVSTRDAVDRINRIAAALVEAGIRPGDRVAVFSATRLEYTVVQFAIWAVGAVLVTIYETSSPEQVEWIMSDSGSVALFCENEQLRSVYDEVSADLAACEHVFVIEDAGFGTLGATAGESARAEVRRRTAGISHEDLAMLIYTSGTTGRPKGCELTHYNFIFTVRNVVSTLPDLFKAENSTLVFLPLAHSFAQVVQVACIAAGVKIGYSTGMKNLVEEFSLFRPRWVFSVPRVFEKVYNAAKQKADAEGKGRIFDAAAKVAIDYSSQEAPELQTRLLHAFFDRLVYKKIRDVFGGNLIYAISGAAALGERLGHFFKGIGLTVLEGYGLTETTAATFFNRPDSIRIGTVGRPTPGMAVAIADDGEILLKGGCVFRGYWNNETATAEAIDSDGWFHTGDVGDLDDDGYLRITGRKKEILVTTGGKNVAPSVLEDRLRAHPLVSQCMVVGDAKPFIAALITLDPETVAVWAEQRGKPEAGLSDDPELVAEIEAAVAEANKAVSKAESIRQFRILPADFTIGSGELTPTLKVKRSFVGKKYGHIIDDIYGS